MKIRHKDLGIELEVELPRAFVTNNDSTPFYKTKGGSFISHNDPEWERVAQKEWINVTNHYKTIPIRLGDDEHIVYKPKGHSGPCLVILKAIEKEW
jgi:hypothetical protein